MDRRGGRTIVHFSYRTRKHTCCSVDRAPERDHKSESRVCRASEAASRVNAPALLREMVATCQIV